MVKNFVFLACTILLSLMAGAQIGVVKVGNASPGRGSTIGDGLTLGRTNLPACTPRDISCIQVPYVFIGNGYWNVESNWVGNKMPPEELPSGETIIIQPVTGGECILNVPQVINDGALLHIIPEKRLRVVSSLVFLH